MGIILYKTYQNLPLVYNERFHLRKNGDLLKHTAYINKKTIKALTKKKVEGTILPKKIYHVFGMDEIFYTQKNAVGFYDLTSFQETEKPFSDREILEFFKSLLLTEKRIHDAEIISGDITYSNIIINDDLEHFFIDFDLACVDNLSGSITEIPRFELPFAENVDPKFMTGMYSETGKFQYFDKANLINMILYALKTGKFYKNRILPTFSNYDNLGLTKSQVEEFKTFLGGKVCIPREEYLLDVLDDLISKDYHLPYRKLRK